MTNDSAQPRRELLLLDAYNLLFRAFSSIPRSLTDPEGRPVNGVYGLVGAVLRLLRERRPTYIAAAFDVPETPTFRHHLYPLYQAKRGPLGGAEADNFAWQAVEAQRVLGGMGIRSMLEPGYEADDLMGTLAVRAARQGLDAVIVSTDRDMQQLIDGHVHVLVPGKQPIQLGPNDVQTRLGVMPSQIVDWKALAGDPSDNIPGVAGIGDKTARELVQRYASLENIYDHLAELSPRVRGALERGRVDAELFSRIVRIQTDLAVTVELESLRVRYDALPDGPGPALAAAGLRAPRQGKAPE